MTAENKTDEYIKLRVVGQDNSEWTGTVEYQYALSFIVRWSSF